MNDKSGSARERREQIYNFIIQYKRANGGRSPTYAEIMIGVGAASKSIVHYDVAHLAETGRVTLNEVGGRAIGIPGELWLAPGDAMVFETKHVQLLEKRVDAQESLIAALQSLLSDLGVETELIRWNGATCGVNVLSIDVVSTGGVLYRALPDPVVNTGSVKLPEGTDELLAEGPLEAVKEG